MFGKRENELTTVAKSYINSLPPQFINLFRKKKRLLPIWSSAKYYVVIKSNFLIYYPSTKQIDGDEKHYKYINLVGCELKMINDQTAGYVFSITNFGNTVSFVADNEKDRSKFIQQVNKVQQTHASSVGLKDFKVESVIGKGHYGRVLLVEKKDSGELYALKEMKLGQTKQKVIHVERMIMEWVNEHPFVLSLDYAFGEGRSMFLVSKFMPGGDLFLQMQKLGGHFQESAIRFYGAELLLALEHLHRVHIIHRDIKPENILLDTDGHIKLADMGLAKRLESQYDRTFSLCGTDVYLPPEMVSRSPQGHGIAVDLWQFGCLLYELYTGHPPFYLPHSNQRQTHHRILYQGTQYTNCMSSPFVSLLAGLLAKAPSDRLTLDQVKQHEFFASINWEEVYQKKLSPPIVPSSLQGTKANLSNFDQQFTSLSSEINLIEGATVSRDFEGFEYTHPKYQSTEPSIVKETLDVTNISISMNQIETFP